MQGHVFVIQGRMEALRSDAVVITTDAAFNVEPHWLPVHRTSDPRTLRPQDWGRDGRPFGAARGRPGLWFLDASASTHGSLDPLLRALGDLLEAVASTGLPAAAGRALPLVAVPVPGIGFGGFRERAGAVITGLLEVLHDVVGRHEVDVVVVTTGSAQFAAIQRERRGSPGSPLEPQLRDRAEAIGGVAASGRLALFLGAGVSVPAGLPSWSGLIEELRVRAAEQGAELPAEAFDNLGVLDQAELLGRLLGADMQRLVAERFSDDVPALSHMLLASLGCREVVTTNYDRCYEQAVEATGTGTALAVMPWEQPTADAPWLLKLHGDAARPETVVLTRGHMFGYDTRWRLVGSVFQSLLMTRELLVVGASMTDDNVLRLAHEVRALREDHRIEGLLGHVLTLGETPIRAQLWEGEMEWVAMGGASVQEQARKLEIFLDLVAMHAWRDQAPYLLDPDYADLLESDEQRELAARALRLARDVHHMLGGDAAENDPAWQRLTSVLRALGAVVET